MRGEWASDQQNAKGGEWREREGGRGERGGGIFLSGLDQLERMGRNQRTAKTRPDRHQTNNRRNRKGVALKSSQTCVVRQWGVTTNHTHPIRAFCAKTIAQEGIEHTQPMTLARGCEWAAACGARFRGGVYWWRNLGERGRGIGPSPSKEWMSQRVLGKKSDPRAGHR